MSGSNVPYQLRPNKFIDRQIFLDLLARLIIPQGPERYIYISMGGSHLIDHRAVYKRLGLDALYSFDLDANNVKRQEFNKPIGAAVCEEFNSADLPAKIDEISDKFSKKKTNLIVWLDYTAQDRRVQLQEAVQTMVKLQHGDIFRITLNASAGGNLDTRDWKNNGAESPAAYRAELLRAQVEDFMPAAVTSIPDEQVPAVLVRCVEMATLEAEKQLPTLKFRPVLITTYKDGQRMMTVTCAAVDADKEEEFPPPSFNKWKFACRGWDDIQFIFAPNLSSREQHVLDRHIHYGPKKMLAALKFFPEKDKHDQADEKTSLQAIKSYRSFHRYYPSFHNVDE